MKRIGITQRVELIKDYNERRDCLDQRWSVLVYQLGYLPVPLANIQPEMVADYVAGLRLDALLLSGGNSIAQLSPEAGDAALERDVFEMAVLSEILPANIPVIGVCRGMQVINMFMGGTLCPVKGHVAVRHKIVSATKLYTLPEVVNSYHHWAIAPAGLAKGLTAIASDQDGNIEAFHQIDKKVLGIMWHPEREFPFNPLDIQLFNNILA